jgi:hypothetical protein
LEDVRGAPLSHSDVLKAAEQSSILTRATSRDATLKSEAALLKTRQNLTALAQGQGVTEDFIDQLRIVSAEATRRGRELNALGINADPIANTTKGELVKKLLDFGVKADDIIKASAGVNFNNLKQATEFYRKFVKPTRQEWIDEYRYINLLSSPRTHIINSFSNLIQATLLNPATRLATGQLDFVLSALTGKSRRVYMKEVTPYYRGVLNAVPEASRSFADALKGNVVIERPDLVKIPTNSKLLRPFQVIPRMLEASDVLFRTLITSGERQAIAYRMTKQGKTLDEAALAQIEKEAAEKAAYFVFRKALDASNETGQGRLLSEIDRLTSLTYQLRKVPGVRWFIPFIQTPMNILKQGIEYSPAGFATLPGAANKTEQVAKAMIGSVVFLGAGSLALQGRLTWSAPTNKKEKDAFYNSGRQPYSVKIGDKWVSFSKIGPIAYPIAMAAAMQWYLNESPKAASQDGIERATNAILGMANFFSDQSYLQGINSLMELVSGESRLSGVQSTFSSAFGQIVPLASLLRWTSHIIDPVYRKPEAKFTAKNLIQSIQKDIPFISKGVPEIKGAQPRQLPIVNSFSPLNVTESKARYERLLQTIRRGQKNKARLEKIRERTSERGGGSLDKILSR